MRPAARAWTVPLAALLAGACSSAGSGDALRPAPVFTRSWSPYTPEELNRDVVACAEEARSSLAQEAGSEPASGPRLRRALHERTAACMEQRGWKALGT
jgi:hypothetical protein